MYKDLAQEKRYLFLSALNCEIGEDGDHLTKNGHKMLGTMILETISKPNS